MYSVNKSKIIVVNFALLVFLMCLTLIIDQVFVMSEEAQ